MGKKKIICLYPFPFPWPPGKIEEATWREQNLEVRTPDSDLSLVTQQLSDLLASLSPLAQTPRLCLQSAFDSFLQIRYLAQVTRTGSSFDH